MTTNWLSRVLAENAHLDPFHQDGAAELAERILAAIPAGPIAPAIAAAVHSALEQKRFTDAHGQLVDRTGQVFQVAAIARDRGHNAAQAVLRAMGEAG